MASVTRCKPVDTVFSRWYPSLARWQELHFDKQSLGSSATLGLLLSEFCISIHWPAILNLCSWSSPHSVARLLSLFQCAHYSLLGGDSSLESQPNCLDLRSQLVLPMSPLQGTWILSQCSSLYSPTDEGLVTGQTTPPNPSIKLSSSDTSQFLVLHPLLLAYLRWWLPILACLGLEFMCYVSDVKFGEFCSHIHKADLAPTAVGLFPSYRTTARVLSWFSCQHQSDHNTKE